MGFLVLVCFYSVTAVLFLSECFRLIISRVPEGPTIKKFNPDRNF